MIVIVDKRKKSGTSPLLAALLDALSTRPAPTGQDPARQAAAEKIFLASSRKQSATERPTLRDILASPDAAAKSRVRGVRRRQQAGIPIRQRSAFVEGSRAERAANRRARER